MIVVFIIGLVMRVVMICLNIPMLESSGEEKPRSRKKLIVDIVCTPLLAFPYGFMFLLFSPLIIMGILSDWYDNL